jgi:hypothetical protein
MSEVTDRLPEKQRGSVTMTYFTASLALVRAA